MALPRLLVIDDQLGALRGDGRNRLREDFCLTVGLQDATGDVAPEPVAEPVAEAVFLSGQLVADGHLRNDLASALGAVRAGWKEWPRWALLLLDMQFKTGPVHVSRESGDAVANGNPRSYFGLELLEALWGDPSLREIPVVVLSSMSRAEIESRFASHGAFDFVDKSELTRGRLQGLIWRYGLIESESVVGRSVPFLRCLREARQRAQIGNDNILLLGETGTGKEALARYIHDSSPRHGGPYVTVYVQGVPESLIEDRLFGHEQGAFSGATASRRGAGEEADGGSLFIDEFGDVSPLIQSKLLRLLDRNLRESQRIGAKADAVRKLDLQVVLATNRLDILESDDFRKDLLSRVRIADPVRVPPLRERREDIPLLAEHFVRKAEHAFAATIGAESRTISAAALEALCDHTWAGNVRSLEQAVEAAVYRFPKLRVLSDAHLRLPAATHGAGLSITGALPSAPAVASGIPAANLPELLRQFASVQLEQAAESREEWAGMLPALQGAFARAAGALLRAALVATLQPTPENPAGELRIHPAVKLAMGDGGITASQAADIIKRVLSMDAEVLTEWKADPLLAAAYQKAVRLRPKGRRRSASKP